MSSFEGKKWDTGRGVRTDPWGIFTLAGGKEKETKLDGKARAVREAEGKVLYQGAEKGQVVDSEQQEHWEQAFGFAVQ